MNLNPEFLTYIVLAAALAVVVLIAYAALLSLSSRHSRLDDLRKRSDLKGLARVANDPGVVETVRLEAVNVLADIGILSNDPEQRKEVIHLLLQLFLTGEGKFCQGVIAAIMTMDNRINHPSFRELILQQLSLVDWKPQAKNRRRLILSLLKKFSATRTTDEKPHPVSVQSLKLMSELAADDNQRTAVLDALRNYLEDPESGVHHETVRALTSLAIHKPDPKAQEEIIEILVDAHQNPECKARLSAVQSLGKLGVESRSIRLRSLVTAALVIGLQDEDDEVRRAAVDLLKQLNTLSAATETRAKIADALILALQNPDLLVRQRALDALAETYLWAETPDRLERTIKALILAMYDSDPNICRQSAKMLSRMESQLEEGPVFQQVCEAFLAALQSPDEELRFLSAETLTTLYQNGRLPAGLRDMVRAQKDVINETGIMSAGNRFGKCPQCGKNILLKQSRMVRRDIALPVDDLHPAGSSQAAYRYFCRECYAPSETEAWPENALLSPEGTDIEDHRPPESEPWWQEE